MNQNKKIWFFTEGYSETECIKCLFRRHFPSINLCGTESDFLQETASSVCYIHNSRDGNKIPYDINETNHWIDRGGADKVIIFCDIEKQFVCSLARKKYLINQMDLDAAQKKKFIPLDKDKLVFVFSKPTIEQIYSSEKDVMVKVLKKQYTQIFGNITQDELNIDILNDELIKPLDKLKNLFSSNGLTYKKRNFAEDFFPRLDFSASNNKTIQRLYSVVNKLIEGN